MSASQSGAAGSAAQGFDTLAIHAGYEPDQHIGSINVPIYASTTFAQNAPNNLRGGYEYGRVANPTVDSLAMTIAALEGARFGRVFSSGSAATDIILRALLRPGDHLIMGHDAYGGTFRLIDTVLTTWGIEYTVVDTTEASQVRAAVKPNTKLVWVETPTNPLMAVTDIAAVAEAIQQGYRDANPDAPEPTEVEAEATDAEAAVDTRGEFSVELSHAAVHGGVDHNAVYRHITAPKLIVDNTFASPYLQQPLAFGADIVLHSTTKYLGGHSDVLGGAIVCNDPELDQTLDYFISGTGPNASPFDAYLAARGIKTLGVRMDRHSTNAMAIAEHLEANDLVQEVLYPGLPSNAGHEVAAKQSTGKGFGGMISVRFHSEEAALAFCMATKIFCLAESLGGVESLLEHPATMTHQSVNGSQLEVPRDLVRISVGIEDLQDLLADVDQALAAIPQ